MFSGTKCILLDISFHSRLIFSFIITLNSSTSIFSETLKKGFLRINYKTFMLLRKVTKIPQPAPSLWSSLWSTPEAFYDRHFWWPDVFYDLHICDLKLFTTSTYCIVTWGFLSTPLLMACYTEGDCHMCDIKFYITNTSDLMLSTLWPAFLWLKLSYHVHFCDLKPFMV